MNQEKLREQVHAGIDRHCSPLTADPYRVQRVLASTNAAPVKKGVYGIHNKRSFGILVALILILFTLTAYAGVMVYQYYQQAIRNQVSYGAYQKWPLDEKISFIQTLVSEGVPLDAAAMEQLMDTQLSDEERNDLADEIVTGYFGEGHDGFLSAVNMMEKDKGQFDTWSLEDKAWLSQQEDAAGSKHVQYEYHLIPGEDDMAPEEALETARMLLPEVYDVTYEELCTYKTTISFEREQVSDGVNPTYHRVCYNIAFYPTEDCTSPYYVKLSNTGELLSMREYDDGTESFNDYIIDLTGHLATPEQKAQFADDIAPQILDGVDSGEEVSRFYIYLANIPYIMPGQEYLAQTDAQHLAETALADTLGVNDELLGRYKAYVSLRASLDGSSDTPVWYFKYIFDQCEENDLLVRNGTISFGYIVALDASDGTIVICRELDESEPFSRYFE